MKLTPALASEYARRWADAAIDHREPTVTAVARRLLSYKRHYHAVSAKTGVPWYFIAVVHQRESGGDFRGVLHNGERIIGTNKTTRLVPAGHGPFSTWEEAAIDALRLKGLHTIRQWDVARLLYELERFNGFGYRRRGLLSAYLWSHTNQYADFAGDEGPTGKYVADGVLSPTTHDQQIGVVAMLKAMEKLDPSIRVSGASLPAREKPAPKPTTGPVVGASIGFLGSLALWFQDHWMILVGIAGGLLVLYVVFRLLQERRRQKATPVPVPAPLPSRDPQESVPEGDVPDPEPEPHGEPIEAPVQEVVDSNSETASPEASDK